MFYKCLLDSATKIVVNIIVLEDGADWAPPSGTELAPQHDGNIGDTWDGTTFVAPVIPEDLASIPPLTTGTQVL